ncbi:MAG: D-2-hydroxyacid dehydrogenase [Cardiobacteriaceae bacterium]|nr:D-2-hydroxyacid dehydrogenase [Cardiobacteriaceae bacterium]
MKAVFLDRATFSPTTSLPAPQGITEWQVFERTPYQAEIIIERLQGAHIAITNKVPLTREILSALPDLKLVQITATGLNNIDLEAAKALGITVYNVAGYSSISVAEHTLMMALSLARGLLPYHQQSLDGTWQQDGRFCLTDLPILDLYGKTWGIVGGGAIGQEVAKRAQAFGMKVIFAERQSALPRNEHYVRPEELLQRANIISLHCPLTPETQNWINAERLAHCKQQPLILNMARGGVVDSQAVVDALNAGKIGGYGTDVFVNEPPHDDEPLLSLKHHPRVLFTPHNAWASENAQSALWRILTEQVQQFIQG